MLISCTNPVRTNLFDDSRIAQAPIWNWIFLTCPAQNLPKDFSLAALVNIAGVLLNERTGLPID